uniref:Brain and muscle arnt-like protein-1 n=1 Tax=Eurydice pulchra TaxID=155694 RepID=T2C8X8_EURPU|nr:brain and muscle arnt-like protein-1 [Eurydice pulchra]
MFGVVGFDYPEYRSDSASGASYPSEGASKKRRGSTAESTEDDKDSSKMPRTSTDWNKRQNHSEIEKRRRDKMNTYIMELSSIIPVGTSRKLDKLTVLRMAVQHMKMLRGSLNSYTEGHYKPSFLSDDELKNLILQAADGFLFVVGCDRGRIIYVSESVSQTLQYTHSELLGTSWFDILHPKDLAKVKEQLSSADINRRDRLVDAKTLLPVKTDVPQGLSKLCPGFRRSFFCRMRCRSAHVIKEEADTTTGCHKKKNKPHCSDKKYSVIHFTGYLKSWAPTKEPVEEETEVDSDSCNLSCLVAVGRVHQPLLSSVPKDTTRLSRFLPTKPIEFISKHNSEGKFVFIDQKASLLLGWLPQELLGTSMYEYYHQDDIPILAEAHRLLLQANEPTQTQVYRFRTKDGSFMNFKSMWKTFKNPWTKDVEYIISNNFLILSEGEVESTMVSDCASSQSFGNISEFINSPGGGSSSSVSSSRMMGNGVQANKIGRKIAEEILDPHRRPESPASTPISPLEAILGANSDRSFSSLLKPETDSSRMMNICGSSTDTSVDSDSTSKQQAAKSHKPLLPPQPPKPENTLNHTNNHLQQVAQVPNNTDLMDVVSGRDVESEVTSDSDEAAMAVIMSLLEADAGLGEPVDFSHLPWPLP